MVRKQVYIEERQEALLKRLSQTLRVAEAELIRSAIDRGLGSGLGLGLWPAPEAWDEEVAFREEWLARRHGRTRKWRREDLYEERLSRHGRARPG